MQNSLITKQMFKGGATCYYVWKHLLNVIYCIFATWHVRIIIRNVYFELTTIKCAFLRVSTKAFLPKNEWSLSTKKKKNNIINFFSVRMSNPLHLQAICSRSMQNWNLLRLTLMQNLTYSDAEKVCDTVLIFFRT